MCKVSAGIVFLVLGRPVYVNDIGMSTIIVV